VTCFFSSDIHYVRRQEKRRGAASRGRLHCELCGAYVSARPEERHRALASADADRHRFHCHGCRSAGCRNVSVQAAVDSIDKLRAWLTSYLDALESTVAYPDVGKYPLFYYPCQALMYIFCFRHAQLMGSRGTCVHGPSRTKRLWPPGLRCKKMSATLDRTPGGEEYVRSLDLPRLINSRFNPLKV